MTILGNTPFEIADRNRQLGIARLEIAVNTQKIIEFIEECDKQLCYYAGLAAIDLADPDEKALAKQAGEDKEKYEAALEALIKVTDGLLEVEA